jgi:hypothetical protein
MNLHSETAAPMGSIIGNGGDGISNKVTLFEYPISSEKSTVAEAYATAKLLTKFSMRVETARLVCRLSGLGGAK